MLGSVQAKGVEADAAGSRYSSDGVFECAGEMWQTEAYRHEETAEECAVTWREKFKAKGWQAAEEA